MHPASIIVFIVVLFTFWTLTLNAFDSFFQEVSAGQPLLDLQNRSNILSPEAALNLIRTYNIEARKLYWSFFILDNAVPLVVFGSLSLIMGEYSQTLYVPFGSESSPQFRYSFTTRCRIVRHC